MNIYILSINYDEGVGQLSYQSVVLTTNCYSRHGGKFVAEFSTGDLPRDWMEALAFALDQDGLVMISSTVDNFLVDGWDYRWVDGMILRR
jgi:hypothetical protein